MKVNLYTVLVSLIIGLVVLYCMFGVYISFTEGMFLMLLLVPSLLYRRDSIEYLYCGISVVAVAISRVVLTNLCKRLYTVDDAYNMFCIWSGVFDTCVNTAYLLFLGLYSIGRLKKYVNDTKVIRISNADKISVSNYFYMSALVRVVYHIAYKMTHESVNQYLIFLAPIALYIAIYIVLIGLFVKVANGFGSGNKKCEKDRMKL